MTKNEVKDECIRHLNEKINDLKKAINDVQGSANDETKSSAGDKHETARAMAQNESDRLTGQLNAQKKLLSLIDQVDPTAIMSKVGVGALVETMKGYFFICAGVGKVMVGSTPVMVISMNTPFGQALRGKEVGDSVSVNDQHYVITGIR